MEPGKGGWEGVGLPPLHPPVLTSPLQWPVPLNLGLAVCGSQWPDSSPKLWFVDQYLGRAGTGQLPAAPAGGQGVVQPPLKVSETDTFLPFPSQTCH